MTQTINDQLHEIRRDGRVNMFVVPGVQAVAADLDLWQAFGWLDDELNTAEYTDWIRGKVNITT
jgi:hypothetical protein